MNLKFLTTLCGLFFIMAIMSSCLKEELSAPGKHDGNITTRTADCFAITYSQGGYGNAGAPYTYLSNNWALITPVVIGCGANTKTYLTALAVQNDLPASGTPGVLGDAKNGGSFRGQVAALVISVKIDNAINGGQLGGMIITSGPFVGLTVNAFVVIANNVLGGCSNAYSSSVVSAAAEAINLSWHPDSSGNVIPTGFTVCLCDIQPGDHTTYTQGFYMSAPPGETYLINNWTPNGPLGPVVIGCTETYNTPESVYNLEAGNSDGQNFRNQLISLTLNAQGDSGLGCLIVISGPYAGSTVDQIIALANAAYCANSSGTSALLTIMDQINNNFDNGTINNGILNCCGG